MCVSEAGRLLGLFRSIVRVRADEARCTRAVCRWNGGNVSEPLRLSVIQVTPLRQNCAILSDETTHRAVVIDPGGDVPSILDTIASRGLFIEAILLTHGHPDHVCGVADLCEALGERQGAAVPVLGPGIEDAFLCAGAGQAGATFGIAGARDIEPDRYLSDGEHLELLGRRIDVRHVPGHSPGHIVFVAQDDRIAVVGDTLFRNVIGRTDFPYGDQRALLTAIRDKLLTLPDDVSILPGHGMPSTIGAERRNNPYLQNLDTL